MPLMARRGWLAAPAILPAGGAVIALRAEEEFRKPVSGREMLRERYFPNVLLTTHEGKQVRFYDDLVKGKSVVVNVMFASCNDACPLITANLTRVQELLGDRMGRDLFFYSITIDPEHDTPEILDLYAKSYGVGAGWLFLTGKPDDIELLRQKLGYVDPNPDIDKGKSLHSGMLRYGNEPLSLWASCQGGAKPEWSAEAMLLVPPNATETLIR